MEYIIVEKKHKALIVAVEKKQLKSDFVWGSTVRTEMCLDTEKSGGNTSL